jgi:probable HAF family extracellular repeat protein
MTASSPSAGAKERRQTNSGYTVKDLGVLSGDTISSATALNAAGQATGESDTPGSAIASLFANGVVKNIDTLNAGVSIGEAIDANGQVAGYIIPSPSSSFHAFLYSNGTMQDINNSKLFPAGTQAFGINDSGDVVGEGDVSSSGIFHAFLYAGGKMVDIGTLGGTQGTAYAINDSNQIVGASLTASEVEHAFLYANGKMTDRLAEGRDCDRSDRH